MKHVAIFSAMTRRATMAADDAALAALRRWLDGHDAALDEWLGAPVRRICRRRRSLAVA